MKFLCPSCKAKYQIADEKVIGRSVKMKCRQCGHLIEIQESVVGATTASSPPPAVTPSQVGALLIGKSGHTDQPPKVVSARGETGTANKRPPVSPGTARAPKPGPVAPPSSPAHKPLAPSARGGAKLPPPPAVAAPVRTKPERAPAPRASGGTANVRTPLSPAVTPAESKAAPAVTTGESKVTSPEPAPVQPKVNASPEPAPGANVAPGAAEALLASLAGPSRKSGEPLAEAFSSAVGTSGATVADQSVGDEWYVGINDNPVGPIPLSELRARAAKGEVTVDSLVWRDGFEDWKPVRSFPELLAVVEEAISSIQAAPVPLLVPDQRVVLPGAVAGMSSAVSPGSTATIGTAAPVLRQNAVFEPAASPPLSAEELAAVTGSTLHRSPKGAWIAVAGALALGLAMGFVFFKQAPAAPEIKYVEVQRSAAPAESVAAPTPLAEADETRVVANADQIKVAPRKSTGNTESKPGPEASAAAPSGAGLKGLSGLRGLGPQSGPSETGASPGATGGQSLDSATLSKSVSRYTPSVRRSCWQPALDSRASDAPTTARVSVKIDIAPSGNVSNVSSSGDPRGYRGLASCIESRVRNWTFPVSSGATTVNVPFVFAAQ